MEKEETKFSSLLHNPRERRDRDIAANCQWALSGRLDPPSPLKFIFQPLCFGKFHQVLWRAVIREAGCDCSRVKGPHLENEMTHSQIAAFAATFSGRTKTFAECAVALGLSEISTRKGES